MQRPSLPVREDMPFQERAWTARRVGQALLAVFILLALAGVFSRGFLSAAKAQRDGAALSADYERFQRRGAHTLFVIHLPKQTEDEVWLRLGPAFQQTYEIEAIQPTPVRSQTSSNGISLFFDAYDQGDMQVVMRARPRRFGTVNVEIARLPGAIQLPVLIFP
jgi:hypothetical protein